MQKKDTEIEFFNHFIENNDYDVFDESGYKRIVGKFTKYLPPPRKEKDKLKVIDFGCGTGSFTSRFLNNGFELYGMDISSNCIRYARKKYPDISFEIGDIEHTGYPDESFDAVLLTGVLHHFSDFSGVIKEIHRILRKGGIVLGYDPNGANPFMWMYRSNSSPFYSSKGITENERLLTGKEIEYAFSSCGFQEIRIESISGVTYKYIDHSLSFIILPMYNLIERLFDFGPLRKRFGSFLITYARK